MIVSRAVSASVTPPIPRQPIGGTFIVAISLLGGFALVQLIAVILHFVPIVRSQLLEQRAAEEAFRPQPAQVQATATQPGASTPATTPVAIDQNLVSRAAAIVEEADRKFRVGDYNGSLDLLREAESMLPSDPAIQFRLGLVLESIGEKLDAYQSYERSLSFPGLDPEIQRRAEQKMELLAQTMDDVRSQGTTSASGPVRDEVGLQPGAVLGIVESRLSDSRPGEKTLRVAVKARPSVTIDNQIMRIFAYFYEVDENGDVVTTKAQVKNHWISPPIDWAEGEPEILDIAYPMPDGELPGSSAEFGETGRKFYGYVLGVYYNGELQDSRAEPGKLDTMFPLPLYEKHATE